MTLSEAELKDVLMRERDDFRSLVETHRQYDTELQRLSSARYLTSEEQLREAELKKLKLRLKDQIHQIMNDYRDRGGELQKPS